MNIILASGSMTRRQLLTNAGVPFTASTAPIDERKVQADNPQWTPAETAAGLALAKARAVSELQPTHLIVGADQVLSINGTIFSKPADIEACRHQLLQLRGAEHQLVSSVVCVMAGRQEWSFTDTATLRMRNFSDNFLTHYLETSVSTCLNSVGGYQIESSGLQLFETIHGDYFTILGLPMIPLLSFLRQKGLIPS